MKNLQLSVDIAENSGNIAAIEIDENLKFKDSGSLKARDVEDIKLNLLSSCSDSYTPTKIRFEL